MHITLKWSLLACALAGASLGMQAQAQDAKRMSFFVTSTGSGNGADLGGLAGADKICQARADSVGAGKRSWRAYLSTSGDKPVDARDRIGKGPWVNAKGVTIAKSVDDLHDAGNANLTKANLLTEKGTVVNGRGDTPNTHDMLTGSDSAGRYLPAGVGTDTTCGNWTKNGEGSAVLGHHDRNGPNANRNFTSWNASHGSQGCSQEALVKTGGAGQFYCFAAD